MPKVWNTHRKAHNLVLKSPDFYCDDHYLGPGFSVDDCSSRKDDALRCLRKHRRALKRKGRVQDATKASDLYKRLKLCKSGHRCGSLACPICARAFQCAKAQAHGDLIKDMNLSLGATFACITIVPARFLLSPEDLSTQSISKAKRWLADRLRRLDIDQPIVGSIDLEITKDGIQLHWHLVIPSKDRENLQRRLKSLFSALGSCRAPVVVKWLRRLAWVNYSHKVVKLPLLLTRHRRLVGSLMIALDDIEPLAPMFLMNVRLGLGHGVLTITSTKEWRHDLVSKS